MILDLLKKRCSVRKFSDKEIPKEKIDYILEAGRLSPSGGNEQPWKFGVIDDKEMIKKISKIAYDQRWIADAQLLIVLCATVINDDNGGRDIQKARFPEIDDKIKNMDREIYSKLNLEEHQTKIPGTHMVLAALEHGIGSTWISYFDVEEISDLLNLPEHIIPSEILAFGYPEKEMAPTEKKDMEEIVFYNKYKG